ncbi:MAG: hypothetical protein Q4G19_00485 [Clostridia bacterium]|nr:hypothetical protein [Clostridia bacterium]
MLFAGLKNTFSLPKKTEHKNVGQPVIQDTIGILGNTSALSDSLTAFQRKTGIVPAVVTVNDENWNGTYSSLEAAAFDVYAGLFRDELHWLIVYSEPSLPDPAFIDWSWESIVGDDTGDVLTDSLLNSFGTRLQHDLSSDQYSTAEALIRAFDAVTATVRETGGGSSVGILPVVVLIAVIVLLFLRRSRKKDAEAPADNEAAANDTAASETAAAEPVSPAGREEHVCAYCGSVLPADAVKCPCCGAARKKG